MTGLDSSGAGHDVAWSEGVVSWISYPRSVEGLKSLATLATPSAMAPRVRTHARQGELERYL